MDEKPRRQRFSAAERAEILTQWKQSGESAVTCAARHGIAPATLYYWRNKDREPAVSSAQDSQLPTFLPVRVVAPEAQKRSEASAVACELDAGQGMRVRIYRGCDDATLRAVISAIRGAGGC